MIVHYKCFCNRFEQTLTIREREAGEDVVAFVRDNVADAISRHHRALSPLCTRTQMEYAKIPVSTEGRVGVADAPA